MSEPTVEFVTTAAALDALRSEWERCHARSDDASIFVSFDWLRSWWKYYSCGRELRVAVARREGRVTGILPMYLGTTPLVARCDARVLRLLGSGADTSPDYLGPIVERERAAETIEAVCRAVIRSAGWDALELSDVVDTSPVLTQLERACADAGIASCRSPLSNILITRLPASWTEYLATLSRERVSGLRRKRRLWDKAGARFFTWEDDPPLDEVVDRLAELHRLRWRGRAEKHAFSSPEYVGFHREVMHALARRGRLRLYCLALHGTLVAIVYCYGFGGEVSYFQSGFDPDHHAKSPGLVLMAYALEQAIGEGASVFDMLKGEYPHKAIWANDRRATAGLRAYRGTLRGQLLRIRHDVGARLRHASPERPSPAATG